MEPTIIFFLLRLRNWLTLILCPPGNVYQTYPGTVLLYNCTYLGTPTSITVVGSR